MSRSIAVVHNNVDDESSIGAIAAWDVREALRRGWQVTVICRDLDPDLAPDVSHRPLHVPPRLHLLQWSVARQTVRKALRGVTADVLVVHQPQLAAIADVWNVHYLSRAARQVRGPLASGVRARVQDLQAAGVAALEDRYLRDIPVSTRVLFCGDGLQADFTRLYGAHPNSRVLYNPAPLVARSAATGVAERRRAVVGAHEGTVLGFLGGADVRKEADVVIAAAAADPSVFLVHAGPSPLEDSHPHLKGRSRGLGNLRDVNELLDIVDVLLVPSRFDPFPLVVAEAAARGVPVVVGEAVGTAALVAETGAGEVWPRDTPLGPLAVRVARDRVQYADGCRRLSSVSIRLGWPTHASPSSTTRRSRAGKGAPHDDPPIRSTGYPRERTAVTRRPAVAAVRSRTIPLVRSAVRRAGFDVVPHRPGPPQFVDDDAVGVILGT